MPEPDEEWKDLRLAELNTVVATFDTVHEAHLAASYLESQGIPARLVDDFLAGVATHLVPALGGIKLLVLPPHAERAAQLVDELRRRSPVPPTGSEEDEDDDAADEAATRRRDPWDESGLLATLVLLFATPLPAMRYSRRARRLALLVAFGAVLAISWLAEFFGCVDRRPGPGGRDPSEQPAEP
jgi:hypothetical protein